MQFDTETVNQILGIEENFEAPEKMMTLMLDDKSRDKIFKKFLDISSDLSWDWFHEYFEDEQAERKSKKQDFTPKAVAKLLNALTSNESDINTSYYEAGAGTGGLLIEKWWNDRLNDPVHARAVKALGTSIFTYDPRNYWYQVEELSAKAIPFLIFNMAIRGMNGVAIQCDSLTREAKDAYFIQNNTDDFLKFSKVYKLEHNELTADDLKVTWSDLKQDNFEKSG